MATWDSFTREEDEWAVGRVLEDIAAGDCYQVNLSHRFSAPLCGSPWELYERLRAFVLDAAYLDCGDHQVLSSSPELFLRIRGRDVETRPIRALAPGAARGRKTPPPPPNSSPATRTAPSSS